MIIHTVGRGGDDGGGKLLIHTDDDGDVHVTVCSPPAQQTRFDRPQTVEFCTLMGGGRSSKRVLKALRELRDALEAENAADPGAAVER